MVSAKGKYFITQYIINLGKLLLQDVVITADINGFLKGSGKFTDCDSINSYLLCYQRELPCLEAVNVHKELDVENRKCIVSLGNVTIN